MKCTHKQFLIPFLQITVTSLLGLGLLTACGGGGGGGSSASPPKIAAASSINGITTFNQTVAATDGDSEAAPGQANRWDIASNFSIRDGWDDQFDNALDLSTSDGTTTNSFPYDQNESELNFFTPELGTANGVITASNSGTAAALHGTHDSRLQQTIDLGNALADITLTWTGNSSVNSGRVVSSTYYYRVVLRDTSGTLLTTLYETNETATVTGTFGTADLSAYQGQTVALSFETRSHGSRINIDNVSVNDTATEFVTNGDFQTGDLSGWTSNNLTTVQNMTSGSRMLNGLDVTRSFYTVPNKSWGRWVDTFSNPTAADISITVSYRSDLGSDRDGIIYPTPNTANKGLTTWDGDNSDRDIGFAFGNVTNLVYTSDDGLANSNGDDVITWDNNISVPAGSSVSIVNFIVMNGTDTADTATDITARATAIDNDVSNIINRFRIDGQYRDGMTQEQIDNVINM